MGTKWDRQWGEGRVTPLLHGLITEVMELCVTGRREAEMGGERVVRCSLS